MAGLETHLENETRPRDSITGAKIGEICDREQSVVDWRDLRHINRSVRNRL